MAKPEDIAIAAERCKRLHDAYATVFGDTPEAQMVLGDLKAKGHHHAPLAIQTVIGAPLDPLLMAFRDGQRAMVLEILRMREPIDDSLAPSEVLDAEHRRAFEIIYKNED